MRMLPSPSRLAGFHEVFITLLSVRAATFPNEINTFNDLLKNVIPRQTLFISSFAGFVGIFVTMHLRRMRRIQL